MVVGGREQVGRKIVCVLMCVSVYVVGVVDGYCIVCVLYSLMQCTSNTHSPPPYTHTSPPPPTPQVDLNRPGGLTRAVNDTTLAAAVSDILHQWNQVCGPLVYGATGGASVGDTSGGGGGASGGGGGGGGSHHDGADGVQQHSGSSVITAGVYMLCEYFAYVCVCVLNALY